MVKIKGKKRKDKKEREAGMIPAVLYGPEVKENVLLNIDRQSFAKVFKEAGETLIDLEVDNESHPVLIYDTQADPISLEFIHIDFYKPNLKEEVETEIPLEIEGEAPAVSLGGTLITNLKEITVKALPKDLPHTIKVDVSNLNTFEDVVTIKDLKLPVGVKALDDPEEIIAQVVEPEKVEEELAKPIEEKMPEKVEEEKIEEIQEEDKNV